MIVPVKLQTDSLNSAADATSHLFFAYLRSLSPDVPRGVTGISALPISLQTLVEATEYPPQTPTLLQVTTTKVVMIVDTVSPTPFALLRRAKNFEYRDDHWHLQEFANYEDPVKCLTDECMRVLKCISSTNESNVSSTKQSTSLRDASWSRFEDIGFGGSIDSDHEDEEKKPPATAPVMDSAASMRTVPQSQGGDLGRPTTPSWADFMSSGFSDETNLRDPVGPLLLPPDKVLPPIAATRGQSSQSHKRSMDSETALEPAELASINNLDMDDSFWWVWITSLSGDEPISRKAVFGRCALLETVIRDTKWLVLEEQVKGAAPEPDAGAQIVEKKRFFSFGSRKGKLNRRKSTAKKVSSVDDSYKRPNNQAPQSKTSIGPDQHKRIQAAAAALQKKHREQEAEANQARSTTGGDRNPAKTNSVSTLQPAIVNEASHAMKWAKNYDKNSFRAAYLNNSRAGTGAVTDENPDVPTPEQAAENPSSPLPPLPPSSAKNGPPPPPKDNAESTPLPPSPEPPKKTLKEATPVEGKKEKANAIVIEQPTELQPQQSTEDANKKLKKKTGNTGFKNMFGAGKKKTEQPPMMTTGAKETSSVAAARAALEAKSKAAQEARPVSSPKPAPVKKKPVPQKAATEKPVPETPVETAAPAPESREPVEPSTPPKPTEPAQEQKPPVQLVGTGSPPQTRRAVESDALSRVDTNERNAADQEFSKFDQGPLVDQPAFVPEDVPESPVGAEIPQTPTNGQKDKLEVATSPEFSPDENDRWAQVRKNAAERSEIPTEEPEARISQSERTDDGDTSGEESESIV